jgi:N-acetylglutamate synthase-like GNAT family acetyltransferase
MIMELVTIEIYTHSYKKDISQLILNIQQTEFGIPITLEQQPDLNNISAFYQINNGNFWIAKIDGDVIGTVALLDIGNNQGALRKMFVHNNCRGKAFGVGQRLLTTLLDWAKQKGYKEIFLGTTAKFLAAQRFYAKNGFIEIDKGELPKAFPVMDVDIKFFRLEVET